VLWWEIHRIINEKSIKPKYLLLENVDRLLKSPVSQRGRDFSIMLSSLSDSGYIVEWRVVNAADYGMPQRRRRVFFMAYHESTEIAQKIRKLNNPIAWIMKE
jgi:DNA (cytosine-5)-methyltransferase 1